MGARASWSIPSASARSAASRCKTALKDRSEKAPDPGASSNIDLGSTTNLSAMPDSRHKPRNAGQILAANHETKIFAAKYPLNERAVDVDEEDGCQRRSNRDGRDALRLSALARIRYGGACGAVRRRRIG